MRRHNPLPLIVGLLLVLGIGTPALAGSSKALLTVSARVVANCRIESGHPVCTKGSPLPKTDTTSVTESSAGNDGAVIVTVNY
ncbi:MAG: hypothetical protein EHM71_10350 [Zetaproteobacteria bacterium]|nr:MAG: hypothetical protein EHM71_10350 [Zetaproteobacteria bacterium]